MPSELCSLKVAEVHSVFVHHPEIARVAQDYCITLCRVLARPRPQLSDLKHTMRLNEETIICALTVESRYSVSRPALQACLDAAEDDHDKLVQYQQLEEEVSSGKCWLCCDSISGRAVRVVQVAVLKLISSDDLLCMRIGELHKEGMTRLVKRSAQLPGTKLASGETSYDALQRLLGEEFQGVDIDIEQDPCPTAERIEMLPWGTYGMVTKYITTEYSALVKDMGCLANIGTVKLHSGAATSVSGHELSLRARVVGDILQRPICANSNNSDDTVSVYVWCSKREFEATCKVKQEATTLSEFTATLLDAWHEEDVDFSSETVWI